MAELIFDEIVDEDVENVVALWQACGLTRPWNDPHNDIAFARTKPTSSLLIGRERPQGPIATSIMVGHDGHRGWVYYLAVAPSLQGLGYGRQAMEAAERWHLSQGVWKMQLMVREGNEAVLRFYDNLDYKNCGSLVLEKWIDPSKRGDA